MWLVQRKEAIKLRELHLKQTTSPGDDFLGNESGDHSGDGNDTENENETDNDNTFIPGK